MDELDAILDEKGGKSHHLLAGVGPGEASREREHFDGKTHLLDGLEIRSFLAHAGDHGAEPLGQSAHAGDELALGAPDGELIHELQDRNRFVQAIPLRR